MSLAAELPKHCAQLSGIDSPWEVKPVELKGGEKRGEIQLGWPWGRAAKCPECGQACSMHDRAPERTWRHLDTLQFETRMGARGPRSDCAEHGVKTLAVPWAEPNGRFPLLFGRFVIDVLLASSRVRHACELLELGWETGP